MVMATPLDKFDDTKDLFVDNILAAVEKGNRRGRERVG